MGSLADHVTALDATFHMPTYARKPVMFVRGSGMCLYDDDGREYLDFTSGIGVVNLGHAHPAVAAAVSAQMQKLVHVSNLHQVEHRSELAAKLVSLFGSPAKVFFANSGAEANEGAFKLARRYGRSQLREGATTVVSAERSFHGRTLATLAATGQPSKQEAFAPLPCGFRHVPLNDVAALEASVRDDVCAILLEPIQGEAGVFPCTTAYLEAARRIATERGALLIFDEVQTGFFRTGPAFAFQRTGIVPDVMTLAKGMANGLPIGAMVARTPFGDVLQRGEHGSTFAGGPVLTAAALATIDHLESSKLGENALRSGALLVEGLRALTGPDRPFSEVRGAGLMVGVTLREPIAARTVEKALAAGLVLLNVGDSILRFLPPLVCSPREIERLVSFLHQHFEKKDA